MKGRDQQSMGRRVEGGLAVLLVGLLLASWVFGSNVRRHEAWLDTGMPFPTANGLPVMVAIAGVILLNAWFVASETALALLKNLHVRQLKDGDSERSRRLQELVDEKQKYIAACTLGSQTSRLFLALLSFLLAPGMASGMQESFGLKVSYLTLLGAVAIIALAVGLLNMVVGELVPKSYATMHPHLVGIRAYGFIRFASVFFSVPAKFVVAMAGLFTARFGGQASLANANQTEEEIKNLVESAEETGEIEKEEKELLHSVFSFTDKVVREVMTPRVDMDALSIDSDPKEIVRLIEASGHTRIPLYEGTDDQIIGIVHAKDLLIEMIEHPDQVEVRTLMRIPLFVPENKDLHELLKEMRQGRVQMAVVQDEFGGTAGIVTVEDIVEELVGDIADEYDDESLAIERLPDHFLVVGKTHVDDVNEELGTDFSSDEFDTIGGFVFGLFGRQPKAGETIEGDGWRFTVAESDGRRISKIRIEPSNLFDREISED